MALRTPLPVQPNMYMTDTAGRPLNGGKVYFGQSGKDPETHPIDVFYDERLGTPANQPVATKNGFLNEGGNTIGIYAEQLAYSVKVLDRYDKQVLYIAEMTRNDDLTLLVEAEKQRAKKEAQEIKDDLFLVDQKTDAVDARLANTKLELESKDAALQEQINTIGGGERSYLTYSKMQAAADLPDDDPLKLPINASVKVSNDPDASKNGSYTYDGTTITKSDYDPLSIAKSYADINKSSSVSVTVLSGSNLISLDDSNRHIIFLLGNVADDAVVEFPNKVGSWIVRNLVNGGNKILLKNIGQASSSAVVTEKGDIVQVYSNTSTLSEVGTHKAPIRSPFFEGGPKTTTVNAGDKSLRIANTAFVERAVNGAATVSLADGVNTLTAEQVGVKTLLFAGTVTDDAVVEFPNVVGNWIVLNATTGLYNIILKEQGQSSGFVELKKGESAQVFSNSATLRRVQASAVAVDDKPVKKLLPKSFTIEPTPSNQSPMYMSNDGLKVWSLNASILWESADYGETWYRAGTFAGKPVDLVRQLDNGELIVVVRDSADTDLRQVYRSVGYAEGKLDGDITWESCFNISSPRVNITSAWSVSTYKNIILMAEYGPKVGEMWGGAVAADGENARYVRMSTDYGKTWKIIFDLNAHATTDGVHLHGVCYDPYWQRIWVTYGDKSNATMYSDDLGDTWIFAHHGLDTDSPYQNVTIYALPDCILFGTDVAPNGVQRINRSEGKNTNDGTYTIEQAYALNNETVTRTHLCHGMFKAKHFEDSPLLIWFGSESNPAPSVILATYDGYTFTELYRDAQNQAAGTGMRHVIGITTKNKVIGISNDGRFSGSWTKITIDV